VDVYKGIVASLEMYSIFDSVKIAVAENDVDIDKRRA